MMVNPLSRLMVDFKQMKEFIEAPFVVERAKDIYLYDDNGKQYIDGIAGVFVASVGHANPRVLHAIAEQIQRLTFAPPLHGTSQVAIRLAERLCNLFPEQFNTVKFASGGSEAIESSIKMSLQYHKQTGHPEKFKIISTYGSYHGGTLGALSVSGMPDRRNSFEPLMGGRIHVHPPNFANCPLKLETAQCNISCVMQFEEAIRREGPETVAAVIVEPVMNAEGLIWPPPSYFESLRDICDKHGVLLIYDEVITGYGRTGTMFFAEKAGAWPDLMCLGKGMSGGYTPLSATVISDKVASVFWGDVEAKVQFNAGHTFAGNPLSCAVGLAILDCFEEQQLLKNVADVGPYLAEKLQALKSKCPAIVNVRGLGLWWGVELKLDNPTGRMADEVGRRVERASRARGLVLRGSPAMVSFAPPLTISRPQIDDLIHRFTLALVDVLGS